MDIDGAGSTIRNNQVVATGGSTNFGANGNAYGILANGSGMRVLNNDVVTVVPTGTGGGFGIVFQAQGNDGLAVNNRITSASFGVVYSGVTGKYRDNLTSAVATPFVGGTAVGTNN